MLFLTRMIGQSVFIGENNEIKVTVAGMRAKNGKTIISLSFEAPDDIPIRREELLESNTSRFTV